LLLPGHTSASYHGIIDYSLTRKFCSSRCVYDMRAPAGWDSAIDYLCYPVLPPPSGPQSRRVFLLKAVGALENVPYGEGTSATIAVQRATDA
jgi:hypothetical protein